MTFLALIREAFRQNDRAEIAFVTTRLAAVRSALDRLEPKIDALQEHAALLLKGQENILDGLAGLPDSLLAKLLVADNGRNERIGPDRDPTTLPTLTIREGNPTGSVLLQKKTDFIRIGRNPTSDIL